MLLPTQTLTLFNLNFTSYMLQVTTQKFISFSSLKPHPSSLLLYPRNLGYLT